MGPGGSQTELEWREKIKLIFIITVDLICLITSQVHVHVWLKSMHFL